MNDQTPPADPDAPQEHTLPSGKVVLVRSHRSLLGEDAAAAIAAQSAPGAQGVVDMHNELIRRMVTELKPGTGGAPPLDGTLDAITAQRADDWRALYALVWEGYRVVTGLSVILNPDDFADPTAPPRDGSESKPSSEDSARS